MCTSLVVTLFLHDCHNFVKSFVLNISLFDKDVIKCDIFWTTYGFYHWSRSSLTAQLNRDTFPSPKICGRKHIQLRKCCFKANCKKSDKVQNNSRVKHLCVSCII